MSTKVAVLLWTEDNSKWAPKTLEHVCRRIFDWLVPQYEDAEWLSFAPANSAAREAMRANRWKSTSHRDYGKIVNLCKAIATQVLRDDGFVFFHVDGDVIWGEAESENLRRFDEVIRSKVLALVSGQIAQRHPNAIEPRVAQAMTRLILLAPHYSIETWLFANTECLRRLGVTSVVLDEWDADLSRLDRTLRPKQAIAVATEDHPELARALAIKNLLDLESSFADAVHRAGACGSLIVRLRDHWPAWVRREYGDALSNRA